MPRVVVEPLDLGVTPGILVRKASVFCVSLTCSALALSHGHKGQRETTCLACRRTPG